MVLNFAHRGSVTEAPENTVSAMKKALAHGIQAIELDVQLTKDDELIVIHDHHLRRFNKRVKKPVRQYTLAEIKQIDIGSYFSRAYAKERLATLPELLQVIPENIIINIEIKNNPVIYEGIEKVLFDCLLEEGRTNNVMVSSFDHVVLQYFQKEAPTIPLGLLFEHRMIRPWAYVKNSGLEVYSIHPKKIHVDKQFVEACHLAGYRVFPFTVNDLKTYKQFISWGVDGVFSNNPAIFSQTGKSKM